MSFFYDSISGAKTNGNIDTLRQINFVVRNKLYFVGNFFFSFGNRTHFMDRIFFLLVYMERK